MPAIIGAILGNPIPVGIWQLTQTVAAGGIGAENAELVESNNTPKPMQYWLIFVGDIVAPQRLIVTYYYFYID